MLQLAKYASFQRTSFLERPFSNLGHCEWAAERVEQHGVNAVLTPGAPFRCGEPIYAVWQLLESYF
jgi:hypothetical protein